MSFEKSFRNINLKSSYETGQEDLIQEFYAPVLGCAISYDRIAGFFSSSTLAIAAKGIVGFIKNNGRMRLIACPRLDEDDVKVLESVSDNPQNFIANKMECIFDDLEDSFQRDHIEALGWMIANGFLEIKFALVNSKGKFSTSTEIEETGIFHQKVGILTDKNGDSISFSGSINETASGWLNNVEEFKVFKSWNEEKKYLDSDKKKFCEFWENKRDNVKTYSLPESIRMKFIEKSKNFSLEKIIVSKYKNYLKVKNKLNKLNLFFYQKEAIKKWIDNNYKLLFQMATGTGKTRTALGCMMELLSIKNKVVIIVSCPQGTLSLQWKTEIENLQFEFDKVSIIDGTNKDWKNELQEIILKVTVGIYDKIIIFTTHETSSKDNFTKCIVESDKSIEYLFIGDEVHGLGSFKRRKALLERYNYRIGLSATPSRWFDEIGTKILDDYFGNKTFEFSINDALTTINPVTGKTFLVPYVYNLEFVDLSQNELEEYAKLSKKVKRLKCFTKESDEYAKQLEKLLFERANIVKNAENKYKKLEEILISMKEIKDLIIFVSPEQIKRVSEIMYKYKISAQCFTKDTGTKVQQKYNNLTERQYVIENFKNCNYKVLIAIKCLDEGIDIPSAQNAILMCNSTNPREYIQRIGRVIRQSPNKNEANIWDLTVRPCSSKFGQSELKEFEDMICKKEKIRIYDISKNAKNNVEALKKLYDEMGE